jgi:stage III sporulation protein AG
MNLKEIINKYLKGGKNKNSSNLILLFLIGVVLVITASFFMSSNSNNVIGDNLVGKKNEEKIQNTAVAVTAYEQDIKDQLKSILYQIDGVGRVEVMVTFESGEETVPAVNNNDASSTTQDNNTNGDKSITTQGNSSSTVVTTNEQDGSTKPLIVKTYKPKVCGVCVVAEGAENSLTQARIAKSVMDLLNVADSKVNVFPMKK